MIKNYVDLKRNEKFERKIRIACDFHSAKYEFTRGRILNIDRVNVSFIEPHKFLIELNVNDNDLMVVSNIGNFNILLDRIVNTDILSKKEMESKNKSVLGRAMVDSLVGLGFIGALSGIG